ncbi:NAD(P)H-dependent oxidoreductase [Chloroflexus sp.]|uniref:NAD(P)H-dependent oxidoreductase n=1 Tax=Chloroflexus sp. TaxID=1904827 RepID=UPI002ADE2631|nr:NAD(P)H-dependent oxidoreductase [Chloroflexus sp.]
MSTLTCRIFILHDHGEHVTQLAQAIGEGAASVGGVTVKISLPHHATKADLLEADGIIIGTPNWTGIKGTLKRWLDTTGDLWEEGSLAGKVGAAFTSSAGRHSGTEFTLLSVLHWMLGSGMIIVGLPWSPLMEQAGSYYGATAVGTITEADLIQAKALGRRVAELALQLRRGAAS